MYFKALSWLVMTVALALYGQEAWRSPAFDDGARLRRAALDQAVAHDNDTVRQEAELARAYWRRYPDIAADRYFGEFGQLGVGGAREHYQRHGQREGRVWGSGREDRVKEPGREDRVKELGREDRVRKPDAGGGT